jgi:2OG-Fe(II) oxygenase superfamily
MNRRPLYDPRLLRKSAERSAAAYRCACPFPHTVLTGVFDEGFLCGAVERFPSPDEIEWFKYDNPLERKLATNRLELIPAELAEIMLALNSKEFVASMEVLTGIAGLVADPDFVGGGLHLSRRGGKLDIHADFNYHPITGLHRRVNVILFLNPRWRPEYGGYLEFWPPDLSSPAQRIAPELNQLVIFNVNDLAYHGYPEPLRCPEHVTRKSIAAYYYNADRPECEKSAPHSTLYKKRQSDPFDPVLEELRSRRAVKRLADSNTRPR